MVAVDALCPSISWTYCRPRHEPQIERVSWPGLELDVLRAAIPSQEADVAFQEIVEAAAWRQDEIVMFGKAVAVPRLTAWYGDTGASYSYSGITMHPKPWLPELTHLRTRVESLAACSFNSVLINLYRDGRDSMGWHSDDESELGPEPVIASVSLGSTRRFKLRRRDDHSVKVSIELAHGDLVIMSASTQTLWQHQIPKTARPLGPRVNLTFRTILKSASGF